MTPDQAQNMQNKLEKYDTLVQEKENIKRAMERLTKLDVSTFYFKISKAFELHLSPESSSITDGLRNPIALRLKSVLDDALTIHLEDIRKQIDEL